MVFLGGVVVHHGGVGAVSCNGAEALGQELVLCAAVLVEDLVDGQLGQLFAGGQTVLQLDLEAHHSHAVPDVSFAGVSQLDFVLDALHGQQGVGLVLDGQSRVGLQGLVNSVVDGNGVGQNGLLLGLGGEDGKHIVVLGQLHAVCLQLRGSLGADAGGVDEEGRLIGGHIAVSHGVGGTLDVHRAQIEQPCQIVQLAHQLCGAAQLRELRTQLAQLLGRGEARVLLRQEPRRGSGQGGTALRPQLVLEVQQLDGAFLGIHLFLQAAHQTAGGGQAAEAQRAALGQDFAAVLLGGRHARLAHPHQLDLGASDLLLGLHEVTAIGPDSALGHGDDEVGVLAVEAGEVGQGSVVVGHILAGVRVSHRDEVDVHAVCLHGLAQGGQTLGNGIHAHVKKPSFFILPEKRPAAMVCCPLLYHSGAQNAILQGSFWSCRPKMQANCKKCYKFLIKKAGLPLTALL